MRGVGRGGEMVIIIRKRETEPRGIHVIAQVIHIHIHIIHLSFLSLSFSKIHFGNIRVQRERTERRRRPRVNKFMVCLFERKGRGTQI